MIFDNSTRASEADLQRADELRTRGNGFYNKQDYETAIDFYTQAIAYAPVDARSYCNRSTCYMKLKK